jgi:hypothetical protein
MKLTFAVLAALVTLVTSTAVLARSETVKFPRGASGTSIQASIAGRDSNQYKIGVTAGQTLSVQLDTSNSSNYFNITAPGASEALYNSSISGNGTSFVVPSSGNYVIDVYLMRNAARRNETASYTLTIYAEGAAAPTRPRPVAPQSNGTPAAVNTGQMPRFCQGEASAKFSVRPQDLTTNMAFKSGNQYVVQGNFEGANGTTFFNCWFGLDGSFAYIN